MKLRQLGKTGIMASKIGFGGEWLERADVVTNFFLAQGRKTGDWKQAVKEAFFHPGKLSSGK